MSGFPLNTDRVQGTVGFTEVQVGQTVGVGQKLEEKLEDMSESETVTKRTRARREEEEEEHGGSSQVVPWPPH